VGEGFEITIDKPLTGEMDRRAKMIVMVIANAAISFLESALLEAVFSLRRSLSAIFPPRHRFGFSPGSPHNIMRFFGYLNPFSPLQAPVLLPDLTPGESSGHLAK
jgi:hypothetical protein